MDTNKDILLDQWRDLKAQVRRHWVKITEDDLSRLSGRTEELVGVLQQRYGYGKAQAEIEINNWVRDNYQVHPKD